MSAHLIDLTGRTFGMLTVLRKGSKGTDRSYKWVCECDCGNTVEVSGVSLRVTNGTKSCGCLLGIFNRRTKTTHGFSIAGDNRSGSPAYISWRAMRARCRSKNDPFYHRYGGRGIRICDRWDKFENFLAGMGERPDGLTLDRIDNDGNYEPGNCKWSTQKEQQNNRSNNRQPVRDITASDLIPETT